LGFTDPSRKRLGYRNWRISDARVIFSLEPEVSPLATFFDAASRRYFALAAPNFALAARNFVLAARNFALAARNFVLAARNFAWVAHNFG
jgi:hypothetical protein